ncbi:MAG: hypothetical protein Q8P56_05145, partial [Candidatus Uhrbacteria bacterium]|nr:hypothetical protein [Candidatus Uhrbacteria bacterium]
ILNKQYTEEEYVALKRRIIEDMKQREEYGEFFPIALSPFGYNDTLAQEFFPASQKDAADRSWRWEQDQGGTWGAETIRPEAIPVAIEDVDASIVKEILRCKTCSKNYRIVKKEFARLMKLRLSIPFECQDCRLGSRMQRFFIPVLYHQQCMCTENHSFHASTRCTTEFETTYGHERKEIVYCNPCYQESLS